VFPIQNYEFSDGWLAALKGGLHNRAGRRTALKGGLAGRRTGQASGLHINMCWRAVEKGGPFDTRAELLFSQLQTFITLYKMADRSMQGRTALNIIEIASFRCSSGCATWRAI